MKNRIVLFFSLVCIMTSQSLSAQPSVVAGGDAAFAEGLYRTALTYYKQAYRNDASDVELQYKLAEAARLSNAYSEALTHYRAISQGKTARRFPNCDFHLAAMYKATGRADSALFYYERFLASVPANQNYAEQAQQQIRSCQWVLDNIEASRVFDITHESRNINTINSESGAIRIGDSLILYSCIASQSNSKRSSNADYALSQVYMTELSASGKPGSPVLCPWGMNAKDKHTGNVVYDPIHDDLYFTRCETGRYNSLQCQIYVMHRKKGKWQKPKRLGGDINSKDFSSTQPAIGYTADSNVILYYASNRPGGFGGFDLWCNVFEDGKPSESTNLGMTVNTRGNEITPFYSNAEKALYFSSDWHYGYGGYDIFVSKGATTQWSSPSNLGKTINTPANDLYFTVNSDDPSYGYLTSNRRGSGFEAGNTCCNDIYRWEASLPDEEEEADVPCNCAKRRNDILPMLPISLYFHNDEPDPKSKTYHTSLTYFQTYNRYMFMRKQYKEAHFNTGDRSYVDSVCTAIDRFFDNDVHRNCTKFEVFLDLLTDDLRSGRRVKLTLEGYASPVHTDGYNFNLSKRRIATIINQMMEHNGGELMHYLGKDGKGSLQIEEVAHGSRTAGTSVSASYTDTPRSVYSVEAARERRIEIQDYRYLDDDSTIISCLKLPSRAIHIGTFKVGKVNEIEIHLPHTAAVEKKIDFINIGNDETIVTGYSTLRPGKELIIYLRMDNSKSLPSVSSFLPLTLRIEGEQVTQTMFLEYTLKR